MVLFMPRAISCADDGDITLCLELVGAVPVAAMGDYDAIGNQLVNQFFDMRGLDTEQFAQI